MGWPRTKVGTGFNGDSEKLFRAWKSLPVIFRKWFKAVALCVFGGRWRKWG